MRLLKFLIGLLLLPAWPGFSIAFLDQLSRIGTLGAEGAAFLAGLLVCAIIYFMGHRLPFLQVFGHEMTHALWSLIFRGRVRSFYASKYGGQVKVTKSNFLVSLAPYFFPLYTIAVVILSFFIDKRYQLAVFFLIGFTLAHHILSTIDSLKIRQSDITKTGLLFSMSLIFIVNLCVIIAIVDFVVAEVSFLEFVEDGVGNTVEVFRMLEDF